MRHTMVEVFYKTKVVEEQMNQQTEYFTLVLIPVPPESFVVIQFHGTWDIDLNQARRDVMVWSCRDYEGDAIREYDKLRAVLQSKGFVHVVAAGELRLAPPVPAAVKPKRRDAVLSMAPRRVTIMLDSPEDEGVTV
jgi:hypothetical protein